MQNENHRTNKEIRHSEKTTNPKVSDNEIFDTEYNIAMFNEIYQKLGNTSREHETIKNNQPYLNNIRF